jgi:hypothetical protein
MPIRTGVRRALLSRKPMQAAPAAGWASLIPQPGLVAAWPFDAANSTSSLVTDPIGGFNATMSNFSLNGSGPTGSPNLNNAGVFNGTTSEGDTTGTASLLTTSNFTFSMWFNPGNMGGQPRLIANDHTDSDNNGFQIYATNNVSVGLQVGNGSSTQHVDNTGGVINTGTWYMLTWTYDGTTLTCYQNGTSPNTGSFSGPVTIGSNPFTFGRDPAFGGAGFYDGLIAGVALWNRVLSGAEISDIFAL